MTPPPTMFRGRPCRAIRFGLCLLPLACACRARPPANHATAATAAASADPTDPAASSVAAADGINLLLITLDTTRADALGCYSGAADLTPNLDRLAAGGVLFERAFSQCNVTNPSHVSILCGMAAIDHGVFSNFARLADGIELLPERMRGSGRDTAAFIAAGHLHGLGWRGFKTLSLVPHAADPQREADATEIADAVIAWLDARGARPFFCWAHFFDPHAPYEPPADVLRSLGVAGGSAGRGEGDAGTRRFFADPLPDVADAARRGRLRDWSAQQALYAAEVHYVDRELQRIFDALRRRGLWDNTVIAVTADHGEGLGEHRVYYDHYGLFEQVLHVPLIIRGPGVTAGTRRSETVGHLDLAPTLAELAGMRFRPSPAGVSLAPLLRGADCPELAARARIVHESNQNRQTAVRAGDWKLIVANPAGAARPPRTGGRNRLDPAGDVLGLFDLSRDPGETLDLSAAQAARTAELREAARRWSQRGLVRDAPPTDAAERERLKRLGYLE